MKRHKNNYLICGECTIGGTFV